MDVLLSLLRFAGAVLTLGMVVYHCDASPSVTEKTTEQIIPTTQGPDQKRIQEITLPENDQPQATGQMISTEHIPTRQMVAPLPSQLQATTGDCSAILQNISAGGDIYLNIKCDTPSEQRIIEAIANGNWEWRCPISVPEKGWNIHADDVNGGFSIIPRQGHYFSQFDFRFDMQVRGEGPLDFIYLNQLGWEDVDTKIPNIDKPLYDQIAAVMEKHPPSSIAFETRVRRLLYEAAYVANGVPKAQLETTSEESPSGVFDIYIQVQYEDGSSLESESVDIYKSDGTYTASLGLREYVEPYPEWSDDQDNTQTLRELSCVANESIGLAAFSTLCSLMFEQQAAEELDCYRSDTEDHIENRGQVRLSNLAMSRIAWATGQHP